MRSKARGFTLIEMMVVIAIIGIFILLVFSLTTQTYGANPNTFSDQLASQVNFARMRSVSTRHAHQVAIFPDHIDVQMGNTIGMVTPGTFTTIATTTVPKGIVIHAATTTTSATPTGDPGAVGVPMNIQIAADGTSTGGTVYVTDTQGKKQFRVVIYKLTGSAYARQGW